MAQLGELERKVLEALWRADSPQPATAVVEELADRTPAVTTILTVLERLRHKGLVSRQRSGRAHLYRAAVAREDLVAEAMVEALGTTEEKGAALARFVDTADPDDITLLRKALRRHRR